MVIRRMLASVVALSSVLVPVCARGTVLYVSDFDSGVIYEYEKNGAKCTFASGLGGPEGIVFDKSGNMFVVDRGDGVIHEFQVTGTQTVFASGLFAPQFAAFDQAGNLFVSDSAPGNVYEFAPDGSRKTFATGLDGPSGLAADAYGNLFVAVSGANQILKYRHERTKVVFASGLDFPTAIVLDRRNHLFVADNASQNIYEFLPNGDRQLYFGGTSGNPESLSLVSGNILFMGSQNGGIFYYLSGQQVKFDQLEIANIPTVRFGPYFSPKSCSG